MSERSSRLAELISELGRRRVFRTMLLYTVVAIVAVETTEALAGPLGLPLQTLPLVAWAAILGFPLAVGLAWTYDVTPRGIVRTPPGTDADRRRGEFWTRVGFRLTLTGLAAALVGAVTWTVLEPFLPDIRLAPDVAAADLPEGSVLVAPVRAGDGVTPETAERVRLLLVQTLADVPGLIPLDPRRVHVADGGAEALVAEARELGAERVLSAELRAADPDAPGTLLLTATLAPPGDAGATGVTFRGSPDDLQSLVFGLVAALAGVNAAGPETTDESDEPAG